MSDLAPFALELGIGAVLLLVFVAGLLARGEDRRGIAWLATGGVLVVGVVALFLAPAGPALGGMFVQDGLAVFAKRLFLTATFIGLLAGLSLPDRVFARRAAEYHLLVLTSLLGMLVLASARDLILLFRRAQWVMLVTLTSAAVTLVFGPPLIGWIGLAGAALAALTGLAAYLILLKLVLRSRRESLSLTHFVIEPQS